MKVKVDINDIYYEALRKLQAYSGMSLSALINTMISTYLIEYGLIEGIEPEEDHDE